MVSSDFATEYFFTVLLPHAHVSKYKTCRKRNERTNSYLSADKLEFIKNPVIAEFLGLSSNTDFTESELEQRIITHIQKFLMELGKGYAFVARQQHIRTEKEDYYIDLVFYNYIFEVFCID